MEINEYLLKLIQIIKKLEDLDLFSGTAKLSRTEFRLLREVLMEAERGSNIISSELARRLGITRSAVSQIVTKLEEKNILKRVGSPTDRKIAYVCLSDHAAAVFEEQCRKANVLMEGVVAEIGAGSMNEWMGGCEKIVCAFEHVRARFSEGAEHPAAPESGEKAGN